MNSQLDEIHKSYLIREVLILGEGSLASLHAAKNVWHSTDSKERQSVQSWLHCWLFLTLLARIARMLDTQSIYRDFLRDALSVSKDSPLLNREARNNCEHAEERLASWVEHNDKGILEAVLDSQECLDFLTASNRWTVGRVYLVEERTLVTTSRKGEMVETNLQRMDDALNNIVRSAEDWMNSNDQLSYVIP